MKPLIITHKNCVDGCCSQAIFRSKFGINADYLELDHVNLDPTKDPEANNYLNKILSHKDSAIYMADFCLSYDLIDKLLQQNNKVIILDHHDSNLKHVLAFEERIAKGEQLNLDISFSKDNTDSGSMLSWKYLYPEIEPPLSIQHVSAGDIWKFTLGESTEHFYTGLLDGYTEPKEIPLNVWDELINVKHIEQKHINIGEPIHNQFMAEVKSFVPFAKEIQINGKKGLIVEAPKKYTSHLGNQLAKSCNGFGLVYNTDEDSGIVRCSLRSVAPFIVNDLAAKFGGGGHPQASAFRCQSLDVLRDILEKEGNTTSFKKRLKP